MGDRITTFEDCPKCWAEGTFECYEALSCNLKIDECSKCGYIVNYIFEEKDGVVNIYRDPNISLDTQFSKAKLSKKKNSYE